MGCGTSKMSLSVCCVAARYLHNAVGGEQRSHLREAGDEEPLRHHQPQTELPAGTLATDPQLGG